MASGDDAWDRRDVPLGLGLLLIGGLVVAYALAGMWNGMPAMLWAPAWLLGPVLLLIGGHAVVRGVGTRMLGILLVSVFSGWFAINLLLANLVTFVPRSFELTVEVVEESSIEPLAGAIVRWNDGSATLVADAEGHAEVPGLGGSQPLWIWPWVDRFTFEDRVLIVEAPGFRTKELELADQLPSGFYWRPAARIRIELQRG